MHRSKIEARIWLVAIYLFMTAHSITLVKHLEKYINEFTFRPNEGHYQIDTIDRMKSLAHGIGGKRLGWIDLVG